MELGHITGWIVGSTLLAAGTLLIGYSLGLRAGARKSSLAKDLRIWAHEQRIAMLEKALIAKPSAVSPKVQADTGNQSIGATEAERH